MNFFLVVLYILFAVGGSTMIKWGGLKSMGGIILPIVNINVSAITLLGVLSYGISFIVYIILLNKFDLSFISPLTIGVVYVLLMFTASIVFGESFTLIKIIGCVLIIAGVLMVGAAR